MTDTGLVPFRAFWPVIEPRPIRELIAEATADLDRIALLAHAQLLDTSRRRWRVVDSSTVPGSGRVTDDVLIYEAPAIPITAHRVAATRSVA